VRVSREIASRSGKKVIIVFTDGADNNSVLTAEAAVRKSKMVGAPVYSIAQGAALDVPMLLKHLQEVQCLRRSAYSIRHSDRIREVFEGISNELKHGYLLAYRPPPPRTTSGARSMSR